GSAKKEMNGFQSDAARMTNPELPYAAKSVDQSKQVREILNKAQEERKNTSQFDEQTLRPKDAAPPPAGQSADPEQAHFDHLNDMIQQNRKAQLESAIGKTPETVAKERDEFFKNLLAYGTMFLLLGGITLLWGLFY